MFPELVAVSSPDLSRLGGACWCKAHAVLHRLSLFPLGILMDLGIGVLSAISILCFRYPIP